MYGTIYEMIYEMICEMIYHILLVRGRGRSGGRWRLYG
jgi:hypothetical protein